MRFLLIMDDEDCSTPSDIITIKMENNQTKEEAFCNWRRSNGGVLPYLTDEDLVNNAEYIWEEREI